MTYPPSAYRRYPPMKNLNIVGFEQNVRRPDGRRTRHKVDPHLRGAVDHLARYGTPITWCLPATFESLDRRPEEGSAIPAHITTMGLALNVERVSRQGEFVAFLQFRSEADLATYESWLGEHVMFPTS